MPDKRLLGFFLFLSSSSPLSLLRVSRWRVIIDILVANKIYMKWTDTLLIAETLYDNHPDVDPKTIRFTDLMAWVMALEGFEDTEDRCGERILEAIQLAWIDEAA